MSACAVNISDAIAPMGSAGRPASGAEPGYGSVLIDLADYFQYRVMRSARGWGRLG
jgi:hypothetical protein